MDQRHVLIVNLSGRGDKDAEEVARLLGGQLQGAPA
jgi:tryptophan synthase beta subunit